MTMAERAQALAAELRPGIEPDPDPPAAMPGDDATEQDRAVRVAGERQRFTALDKTLVGDPSAAPDQRAFLVVTSPYETSPRGNGIQPFAAHEAGEYHHRTPSAVRTSTRSRPGGRRRPRAPRQRAAHRHAGHAGHRLKALLGAVAHAARLPASVRASRLPGRRRLMRLPSWWLGSARWARWKERGPSPSRGVGDAREGRRRWVPGQCSAVSPRAASSARPATSQVT